MLKKILSLILSLAVLLIVFAFIKFKFLGKALQIDSIEQYLTVSEHNQDIQLTFLGCAGFMIQHHEKSILCDPFISNPNLAEFGTAHTSWTKYIKEDNLKTIDMVTISHGHYDHCYDIEGLCRYIKPSSKIIADASVQNQLNAIYNNQSLQKIALQYTEMQTWIYNTDSTFRIFPLQSIHNPHIGNIEFLKGKYTTPLPKIPSRPWQWKKGEAYSYLIDLMKNDSITYRIILVNGDITESGITSLKQLSEVRKSDLQLQIFWKEKLVAKTMDLIYNITQPKQIIFHHWNNFFVSNDQPLQYFRDANLPAVLKKYNEKGVKVSTMLPFTKVDL